MLRQPQAELLDSDAGTPAEVAASLGDLRRINRWFGGVAMMARLLERAIEPNDRRLRLLDVGAGPGDIPLTMRERFRSRGVELDVVLIDRMASHMTGNGTARVAGNALALPFPDGSFDLVSSSLFLHHFSPEQVRQVVGEGLRVARRAVLVHDLRRHPLHLALTYAGLPLFSRITRHDAPASVRQAYTVAELREMLSGIGRLEILEGFLFRVGIIVWKESGHRGIE